MSLTKLFIHFGSITHFTDVVFMVLFIAKKKKKYLEHEACG